MNFSVLVLNPITYDATYINSLVGAERHSLIPASSFTLNKHCIWYCELPTECLTVLYIERDRRRLLLLVSQGGTVAGKRMTDRPRQRKKCF